LKGKREALIIATGSYTDPELSHLRSPAQDAEALASVLTAPSIGNFAVRKVFDQPEHELRLEAQQFFAERSRDDLLLVHVSCHGIKDDNGRLYFAATNTQRKWLAATGFSAALLNELMEQCRARSIVLLLDCCYSGAFVSGSKSDEGVHLKEEFQGHGRAVLTASNSIEYAWEGEQLSGVGQPSVFTAAIVEGLRTGKAAGMNGLVSVDDLYGFVYERVRQERPAQTPLKWTFGMERGIYLAHDPRRFGPRSREQLPELPEGLLQAIHSEMYWARRGAIEGLIELLSASDKKMSMSARLSLRQLASDSDHRISAKALQILEGTDDDAHERKPPPPKRPAADLPNKVSVPSSVGIQVPRLTPTDIQHEEFTKAMRGYAMHEVDVFLDKVTEELSRRLNELERRENPAFKRSKFIPEIKAIDISRQEFTKAARGYAMKEVDLFLDRVEAEFRNLEEQLLDEE
jgi:DivIVA domain-containing protein